MQTEKDFIEFAKTNRLRRRIQADGSSVLLSSRNRYRGVQVAWNSPITLDFLFLRYLENRTSIASKNIFKRLCDTAGKENVRLRQGGPPGEWVAEIPTEALLPVAKVFGLVKRPAPASGFQAKTPSEHPE